jgi:hypothetical protein
MCDEINTHFCRLEKTLMQMTTRTILTSVLVGFGTLAATALAQPLDFVTVGAAGNADASPQQFQALDFFGWGPVGAVNYEYRLTRTEVTNAQYLEFVAAYSPFYAGPFPSAVQDWGLQGFDLYSATNDPADPQWFVAPGAEQFAADMSWINAARYCNWLHNDRINAAWAFETGAYDTSTFVNQGSGVWSGQNVRSPNARFWVPSLDEWVKGMYYDPNKFGQGVGGYNLYPTGSDIAPVTGLPGTPGAQTSVDLGPDRFNVGSYPNVMSPWGLLDGSGSKREMAEWDQISGGRIGGVLSGTSNASIAPDLFDLLGYSFIGGGNAQFSNGGLRLASVVPTPAVATLLAWGLMFGSRRTRRTK